MATVVMKFGGASLATPDQFAKIARLIARRSESVEQLVVVVSAMGKTTDELIKLAHSVNPTPPQREYDMLLSVGERISMSLLAMALKMAGKTAYSLTGSQSGIITCSNHTEARIVDVRPHRIVKILNSGAIAIVAGFQGVSREGEITTLGRGGSDTTAVALGVALEATSVEFYKDVQGFYSADPKLHKEAKLLQQLRYSEAAQILKQGGRILHARAIELAAKNRIPLKVLPFEQDSSEQPKQQLNPEGEIVWGTGSTIFDPALTPVNQKLFE